MNWGTYGILVIFALFVLILIFNPNLSCFGKRIKSPFYPLFRRRKKKVKTQDYDFSLVDDWANQKLQGKKERVKTEGYGFSRVDDAAKQEPRVKKRKAKTQDYGFHLVDDSLKQESKGKKEKKDDRKT